MSNVTEIKRSLKIHFDLFYSVGLDTLQVP
jgi:hypothetical protein